MKKSDSKFMHPSDQIVLIMSRIYNAGMTSTSGGNISILDKNGDMWVTPSAIDKGTLSDSDIICVKKNGEIKGKYKPSSEYPFHKAIYDARPDIKAVIHAHPPALVAFSIVKVLPDTNIFPQAKNVCGDVGFAAYGLPGSDELGERIAKVFEQGYNSVIMENHGIVVGGKNLKEAFDRLEMLEFCSNITINAKNIGTTASLTDKEIENYEKQSILKIQESKDVDYPSDELAIREEIFKIILRIFKQGLMNNMYGTVSARWRGNDFLISPNNINRSEIKREDIVQIKDSKHEARKTPCRNFKLHQEIYKQNTHINSIIQTQTPYLMAFGVTGEKIDVRTIPESWIFLQDMPNVSFDTHFDEYKSILRLLSQKIPAMIIENDSILVTGNKLLQTFDKLEVAEFSAKSIVIGKHIGNMQPINNEQIEALRENFL